jgi:long-subunit acyl-CoA synthetase (AMP-forming)
VKKKKKNLEKIFLADIFRLNGGEIIFPESLERVYLGCPVASQILVYGDTSKKFLIALIIPSENNLLQLCARLGFDENFQLSHAFDNSTVTLEVFNQLKEIAKKEGVKKLKIYRFEISKKKEKSPNQNFFFFQLKSHEIVNAVILIHTPFTIENGLLTPSGKVLFLF